jgi:hypothetical protein
LEIRKPITQTSAARQLKQLAGMGVARAIATIDHTIAKGWQGLVEPEATGKALPQRSPKLAEFGL